MTNKDIIDKEEKAYNLFSNRPPKDILAILNLHDDEQYKRGTISSKNNDSLGGKFDSSAKISFRNFSVEKGMNLLEKSDALVKTKLLKEQPPGISSKKKLLIMPGLRSETQIQQQVLSEQQYSPLRGQSPLPNGQLQGLNLLR